MKFEILTLIDITQTNARFNTESKEWHQQQNFITVMNTVGLRANLTDTKSPELTEDDLKGVGFGSKFKGKQKYWRFVFEIEYGDTSVEQMMEDFHQVPFISELNETVKFKDPLFDTSNRTHKNILFRYLD